MNPERWQRVEQLYHSAFDLEPAERSAFLAEACASDSALRRDVESLLAQTAATGALIDEIAWAAADELAAAQTNPKPGEFLGPYQILGLLGSGGMGEVYSALDTRLDRKVAIKICQSQFSGRFEREARAISALNHPNICTLYDIGPNYLVTELVEGETLRGWLKRALGVEPCLKVARQVLEALRASHGARVIHRDLKPENIMVRSDGYVKVLDFGLAKRMSCAAGAGTQSTLTTEVSGPGQMLGTIAYMSPEQILGQEIDQRSDLFAFGIILYEMLAGKHPWRCAVSVETLHAILHDEPAFPETVSPRLVPILQKLLRKNPEDRFSSAEAVREALAIIEDDRGAAIGLEQVAEPLTSIAVLPFLFLNEIEDGKAYSLGFADALITTLGSLEDIVVLPTSTVVNRVPGVDPARTCRELGVRHLLQGSVQKQGAHWRVSTQLFDSRTQKIAYAEKYDFVRENVFEVQDEIGLRVADSLQVRFRRTAPKSRDRYSSDPEAFEECMEGLRESYSDKEEIVRSAARHLARAVEGDPEFALAHATLSYVATHISMEFDADPAWRDKAEHHCGRALQIDPSLPEGHSARAFILWSPAKNFQHAEAIAELEKVLAAQPNNERAHNRMAAICSHIGRFEDALVAHKRARQSNPKTRANNLEFILLWSGDFARAEEAGEAWIREKPGNKYALWYHPMPALMLGNLDAAEQRLATALKLHPAEPLMVSVQAMFHARRGERGLALECIHSAQETPLSFGHAHHTQYQIACAYAVLGEIDKAIAWLEHSARSGNPCWPFFKADPHLQNLRVEPRFQRLVAELEREYTALKIERL